MSYIIFNGEQVASEDAAYLKNRAFAYGDGVFETIRAVNGKVVFLENHYARLIAGLKALKISVPAKFSLDSLRAELNSLLALNNLHRGARVRLTAFRDAEGYFLPRRNDLGYCIESVEYEPNEFSLNREGLAVDTFPEVKKQLNPLSSYKTLNSLIYILASIYRQEKNLDEALLLNTQDTIIEAAGSNIFIVKNGQLFTPSLADGCLGGTMRMNVINIALENGIKVFECPLTPQSLLNADEIFLTNAIHGVQWVGSYHMKRYYHKTSDFFINKLNELTSAFSSVQDR